MKNKLYIFGIITVLVIVIGCLFKMFHWPGASFLLAGGLLNFILIYLPIAMFNSYKNESQSGFKYLYIIGYVCIFIVCTGMLFKIQNWPFSHILLVIGIPIPFVLFLPAYLLQNRNNKQLNYKHLLLVLFFFAYFACITALLALNVRKSIIDETIISAYNFDSQTKLVNSQLTEILNNKQLKDSAGNSNKLCVKCIQSESASIDSLIDRMKNGIVSNINEENKDKIDANGNINLWEIDGKDNKSIYNNLIFINKATQLQHALHQFKNHLLSSVTPKDTALIEYINQSFNINENWQESTFNNKRMISIIESLYGIKNTIALVRYEAIQSLDKD